MSEIPGDLLYTKDHEWIRVEGTLGVVGITDYAQETLGDLTFVELPEVGAEVAQGDEAGAVESTKAAASVYAPASGTIVEVNTDLEDDPGRVNADCYGDGWIFKIELSDEADLAELKKPEHYRQMLASEE